MALTSANVRVATTGAIYVAATGTAAPTSSTSSMSAWTELGYYSEDGFSEARERSTEDIKGHDGSTVRTSVTESKITYTLTLIETNAAVLETFYGAAPSAGSVEVDPSETGGRKSFVLDAIDGTQAIRTYLPTAEVTEVGEQTNAVGEPIGYEITITAYPSTGGYSAKKWYAVFGS